MAPPADLDTLALTELKAFVVRLLGKVAALEQTVAAPRAEIARLKGLKGRPVLKPSGMEKASEPKPPSSPDGDRAQPSVKAADTCGLPPVEMLLANSAGSGWVRHEPDEGWLARARERGVGQPSGDTDEVEGGCGEHVLEVHLR